MPETPGDQGRTILVVEDEYFVALATQQALEQRGWKVLGPLSTVENALKALEKARPDAALLDVNLRGRSVAPVARELRDGGVPFGLITGYSGSMLDDTLLESAPRLQKPATDQEITMLVTRLLGERQ